MTIAGFRQWSTCWPRPGSSGSSRSLACNRSDEHGRRHPDARPITADRIDDAVIVEAKWGNVEITSTYVVVKLWDWRHQCLPLSFITKPFQELDARTPG
jgi:hypothetical protein